METHTIFLSHIKCNNIRHFKLQGLASYCKAETTSTFYFSILTLSNAFLDIDNREMKSESGFSFAIASQPFKDASENIQRKTQTGY